MARKARTKHLEGVISREVAERFLTDLANFRPTNFEHASVRRFFLRWGSSFPEYDLTDAKDAADFYELLVLNQPLLPIGLAPGLRAAWSARTSREREWLTFIVRRNYSVKRNQDAFLFPRRALASEVPEVPAATGVEPAANWQDALAKMESLNKSLAEYAEQLRQHEYLPPATVLDVSVRYFHGILDRAQVCSNPQCATPYFLTSKSGQKFCSAPCSLLAQQESKRKWWARHGSQQRREKKQEAKGATEK